MTDKTIAIIVGLVGTLSTLTVSCVGFYFTAASRRAPLREALFLRQLDLITKLIRVYGRIKTYSDILRHKTSEYSEQALADSRPLIKEFSELQEEGAGILSTELWVEVKELNDRVADAFVCLDETGVIDEEHFVAMSAQSAKTFLLARTVLGIDELTDESLELLSTKDDYERVSEVELGYFKKMHKGVNSKKK